MLNWFSQTFPQLPITDIITHDEAAAFAQGEPGTFPAPRFVPRQHLLLPRAAVCLLGDAVHAFPPDIGQGVNAALRDVSLLNMALDAEGTAGTDSSGRALKRALKAFGSAAAPEAKALAKIAAVGFPYQYSAMNNHLLCRAAWFANFKLRSQVLAKLAPRYFHPSVISLVPRTELSYSQIWEMAAKTTRRIYALSAAVLLAALWPLVRMLI